jgi:hypothetical protein
MIAVFYKIPETGSESIREKNAGLHNIEVSIFVKGCKMPALNRRPVSLLEAQRAGV